MKAAFLAWIKQPTTIHALGSVALGVVAYVAHAFGASNEVACGCGLAVYALTHAGINDNSTSKSVEMLVADAAQAYVSKSFSAALPKLLADAQNVAVSFEQPPPAANAPEPQPAPTPAPAPLAAAPTAVSTQPPPSPYQIPVTAIGGSANAP